MLTIKLLQILCSLLGFSTMNDFNIPSSQDIQKCLALNYDIEVDKVNRLEVGADSSAFCFQATTIKGSNFFVKVKQGHVKDKSLNMTQFLFDQGIHQTITPIKQYKVIFLKKWVIAR